MGRELIKEFLSDKVGWIETGLAFAFFIVVWPALVSGMLQVVFLIPLALWPRMFRAGPTGFGQESVLHNVVLRIRTLARPEEAHDHYSYSFKTGMHHSAFYSDPQSVCDIAQWIQRVIQEPKAGR